jgi:hypothetical protein
MKAGRRSYEVEDVELAKNNVRSTCLRLKGHSRKPGNIDELLEGGVSDVAAAEVDVDRVYAICVNNVELLVPQPCKGAGLTTRVSQLKLKTKLSQGCFVESATRPNLWRCSLSAVLTRNERKHLPQEYGGAHLHELPKCMSDNTFVLQNNFDIERVGRLLHKQRTPAPEKALFPLSVSAHLNKPRDN